MTKKDVPPKRVLDTLELFFETPEHTSRPCRDLYIAGGRDLKNPKNVRWLQNRLTPLREYGLVTSTNEGSKRILVSVETTMKARNILRRIVVARAQEQAQSPAANLASKSAEQLESVEPEAIEYRQRPPTLDEIGWGVEVAREQCPHLNIVFRVEVRKGVLPPVAK